MGDFDDRASRAASGATAPARVVQRAPGKRTLVEARYGVQRRRDASPAAQDDHVHAAAEAGLAQPATALPHADRIQAAFGRHDVSGVQAHVGGAAAEASAAMGAQAYATGDHVAFGGAPDLHTAAHEAAHVVQQRAGVSLKGGVGAEGDRYERHADAVADAVVGGRSAEGLLDQMAPAAGGGGGGAVQRKMDWQQVTPVLSNLLEEHGLASTYQEMWKDKRAKTIATEVGNKDDTEKSNVKRRLTEHETIKPLLRNHRMTLEGVGTPDMNKLKDKGDADPKHLDEVHRAFRDLLFFHASKSADDVRGTGLDPHKGGVDGGLSDERSLKDKRDQNLKAAKGNVFVSRKYSEAKGYADGDTSRIVMVIVPKEFQSNLQVDPDSQFGVMGNEYLKGTIQGNGYPNWWGFQYIAKEIKVEEARDDLTSLWGILIQNGKIGP